LELLENVEFKGQPIGNNKNIFGGMYMKQRVLVNRKPAGSLLCTQYIICCV